MKIEEINYDGSDCCQTAALLMFAFSENCYFPVYDCEQTTEGKRVLAKEKKAKQLSRTDL